MALLVLLLTAFGSGCSLFETKQHIVFVREDLTVDGKPRQILKTTEPVEVDVAYFDGERWIVAAGTEVPAGWLIVSPAVIKEDGR